jgi:hypothetical protein
MLVQIIVQMFYRHLDRGLFGLVCELYGKLALEVVLSFKEYSQK